MFHEIRSSGWKPRTLQLAEKVRFLGGRSFSSDIKPRNFNGALAPEAGTAIFSASSLVRGAGPLGPARRGGKNKDLLFLHVFQPLSPPVSIFSIRNAASPRSQRCPIVILSLPAVAGVAVWPEESLFAPSAASNLPLE